MADGRPAIRLYTYAMSPYAAKVHCFLLAKGLPFECFYIHPLRVAKDLPVGRQIPVVTVDGESRADSTPIGLWLEELFPERPLLPGPGPERDALLAVDTWVTEKLIPGSFRSYPGEGLDLWRNGWKLSHVMNGTAQGGLPWILQKAWPLVIRRVAFVRRLVEQAHDGRPVRESKLALYDAFVKHLRGGPFVGGRETPSLPDFSAYPQFALFWCTGFRGSEDILGNEALMAWLRRMRPHVDGVPPMVPPQVRVRELPA